MRVGDKVIITLSTFTGFRGRVGVINTIDNSTLTNTSYPTLLPYKVVLDDNTMVWCEAIPYSSLMMELM